VWAEDDDEMVFASDYQGKLELMARPEEGEKMVSTRATTDKAELDRLVKLTIEKVEGGAISLDDVLAAIAPTPKIEDDASDRLPLSAGS
jgi:hypothetical protein